MEPVRKFVASARDFLGGMTPSQKLLIGSLAVIGVMTMFLVVQYTARPAMVELFPAGDVGSQQVTLAALQSSGIPAQLNGAGQIEVPAQYQEQAVSELAEAGALPNDTTLLFANLLQSQSFYSSKQQNDQAFTIALQNELSRIIRGFDDVRDAKVVLDIPEAKGIGRIVREPTAAATVFTVSGRPIDQGMVDAVADLIAGARAGLKMENVRVIDGTAGRQRRPTSPDQAIPTTYLEHATAVEELLHTKLTDMLSYIHGASIAVTAHVDVTRVNLQETRYFEQGKGSTGVLKRSLADSTIQTSAKAQAEPGVRSNAQGSVVSSGAPGPQTSLEEEQGEKEFDTGLGSQTTTTLDPRGYPTRLAASVNVPRSYIVQLLRGAGADESTPEPTEQEVLDRFALERTAIEESIRPHLVAVGGVSDSGGDLEGNVVVSMVPVDVPFPGVSEAGMGLLGGMAGGGGGQLLGGGIVEKGLMALLAVGAMGMMLMMVRKATRPTEIPSAEELSGVPPTLPTVNDMVGEAEESEAAMTGIEVGDDEVRVRKLVEQVEEMVASNPDGVAGMLGRWIVEEH